MKNLAVYLQMCGLYIISITRNLIFDFSHVKQLQALKGLTRTRLKQNLRCGLVRRIGNKVCFPVLAAVAAVAVVAVGVEGA